MALEPHALLTRTTLDFNYKVFEGLIRSETSIATASNCFCADIIFKHYTTKPS